MFMAYAKQGSVVLSQAVSFRSLAPIVTCLGCAALNIGSLGVAAVVIMHMTTAAPLNAADPKTSIHCRRKHKHYRDHNVTAYLHASFEITQRCAYYAPTYLTVCLVHRRRLMVRNVCMLKACTRYQSSMRLCSRYAMDGWVG